MVRNTYAYQVIRALERKLYLIDLRGGKCEKCGYDKNLTALDFHHIDPKKKEHQLDSRKLSNSSMKWILKEFKKCKVLCSNCHREEHSPNHGINKVKKRIKEFRNSIIIKTIHKPKCVDCGIIINYTYKRCRKCKCINSKIVSPDLNILLVEYEKYGQTWCSLKYKVDRKTVYNWVTNVPLAQSVEQIPHKN